MSEFDAALLGASASLQVVTLILVTENWAHLRAGRSGGCWLEEAVQRARPGLADLIIVSWHWWMGAHSQCLTATFAEVLQLASGITQTVIPVTLCFLHPSA